MSNQVLNDEMDTLLNKMDKKLKKTSTLSEQEYLEFLEQDHSTKNLDLSKEIKVLNEKNETVKTLIFDQKVEMIGHKKQTIHNDWFIEVIEVRYDDCSATYVRSNLIKDKNSLNYKDSMVFMMATCSGPKKDWPKRIKKINDTLIYIV